MPARSALSPCAERVLAVRGRPFLTAAVRIPPSPQFSPLPAFHSACLTAVTRRQPVTARQCSTTGTPPWGRSFPVLIPVEASGFATLCYETRLPTTSRTCALAAALARPSPAASPAASKAPRDNRATAVASLTPFPKGGELDWRAGERAVIGKGDGHPAGCPRWFNRAREFRTKEQDGTARKQWLLHSRHAAPWSPTLNLVERGGASSRRE